MFHFYQNKKHSNIKMLYRIRESCMWFYNIPYRATDMNITV